MIEYRYDDGLESERLITKFIEKEDWSIWARFYDDPNAGLFLPSYNETEPEEIAKKWIDFQLKRYRDQKFGMQWLIDLDANTKIGQCGLLLQEVEGVNELEVGYSLMKPYWGQGFATEAARLFRDYGFNTFDVDSIISLIDPKNVHSQKVAERNGMTIGPLVAFKGHQLNVWRISRSSWEKIRQA